MNITIFKDKNNLKNSTIFSKFHRIYDKNENIIYEGEMKDDKKHGIGVYHNIRLKNNETNIVNYVNIKGFFIDNKLTFGYIYDLNDTLIYQGNFQNNIPNGEGLLRINFNIRDKKIYYYFRGIIKNFEPIGIGILYDIITRKKLHNVYFQENQIKILKNNFEKEDIVNANLLMSLNKKI